MSPWESVLLGVVQGATEFLPVSSSGHLVIGQALLGLELPGVLFEVVVHVATLLSILLVYRTRVAGLARGAAGGRSEAWAYLGLLALATLPAVVVGLFLRGPIEGAFETPAVVGIALLITGTLLWSTRWSPDGEEERAVAAGTAFVMGVAQSLAIIPGISRSGSTVVVALWLGVEPREAAAFSFLMAVPAIAGAGVLQLWDLAGATMTVSPGTLIVGGIAAGLTGIAAIRTFVAVLQRRAFHRFGPYCWSVGALFLLWLGIGA